MKISEFAIKNKPKYLLSELRGFKFVTTLVLEFKRIESDHPTKYITFYSKSKAETIIDERDIDDEFESIYNPIMSNIQKSLGKESDWIIDSVGDETISISKYNFLTGSSDTKLPKELHHPKKVWLKVFARVLDFKYIKCPVKVRDIHKIKKKRIALALVFLVMTIRRKYQIYIAKKYFQETYWFIIDKRRTQKALYPY